MPRTVPVPDHQCKARLTQEAATARTWLALYAKALGLPHSRGTASAAILWYVQKLARDLRRAGKDPRALRMEWQSTAHPSKAPPEPMPDLSEGEAGGEYGGAGPAP